MTPLSNEQKQLLFDYCTGLASEKQTAEAKQLISSNEEAAEIYSKLKSALAPLESAETESCPDDLAEGAIWRLNNLARSSQLRLQQLLTTEQARKVTVKSRLWRNLGELVAAAAVIVFVAMVLIPTLQRIRQDSWRQHQCQMQLSQIFRGIKNYSDDYDGKLPAVATATGAPWWKVGYQGKENHSNTRHLWLLVKGDYVKPADFMCPGSRSKKIVIRITPSQVKYYNDFPARRYVTYSLRIRASGPAKQGLLGRKVLMADLSPLFERLPQDYSKPFRPLHLTKELLTLNSINHNRRGQNILFDDGRVKFIKMRRIGSAADDIFTLQDTNTYQGVEVPSSEIDTFLAP